MRLSPMIETDPVDERERLLAAGLQRLHREMLGYDRSSVHVHLDGDALVCVVEGPGLPTPSAELRERMIAAAGELIARILDRRLEGLIQTSRPLPDLDVSVLRLAAT